MKHDYYDSVRLEIALRYVETNGTVRTVAEEVGLSKTMVHRRLIEFIKGDYKSDEEQKLAQKALLILERNKKEKHMRGGNSTKMKFMAMKENSNK